MGWGANRLIELEQERERKQEKLLELPITVESHGKLLRELEDRILSSEEMIEELLLAHEASQRWKARLREYVLGGLVGAVISLAFAFAFSS